jgi:hypothetical protein
MYGMSSRVSGAKDMIVGIKYEDGEKIVTLCDEELLGKKITEDFYINPRFYSGESVDEEEAREMLKDATIVNAVGKNSVEFCIKEGYVDKENVIKIKGIPHVMMVLIK